MPVSIQFQITPCVNRIIGLQPKSVLDVGCGFGKWGYLCREYLDAFHGRWKREDWAARIDGIEFFEPYIQDHQRALYSNIMIGDIRDLCKDIDEYDLIIAGDVIEHMHKDEAEAVVETLYAKARKMLIVNIPLGGGWDHPEQYGNSAELHRSEWYLEDFQGYALEFEDFHLPGGLQYGAFFCAKDIGATQQIAGFLNAAEFYANRDDVVNADRYACRALAVEPASLEAMCMHVDCQVKLGDIDGALETLEKSVERTPESGMTRLYLAQLLNFRGRSQEATLQLQHAAAIPNLDPSIRSQIDQLLATWT